MSNLFCRIALFAICRNNECQGKSVNNSLQKQSNITNTYITKHNSEERQNYNDRVKKSEIAWGDYFGSQGNDPEVTLILHIHVLRI